MLRIPRLKSTRSRLYYKFFLGMLLLIAAVVLVLSFMLYLNFERIALHQVNTAAADNLSRISYSTSVMMDSAKTLLLQIYEDRDMTPLLYKPVPDANDLNLSIRRLNSYLNTTHFIQSIYVYNGKSGSTYITSPNKSYYPRDEFFDKSVFNIIEDANIAKKFIPIPRKAIGDTSLPFDIDYYVYTFLYYESSQYRSDTDNVIIVNISEEWIRKIISSLDSGRQGSVYIIDKTGRLVISEGENKMLTDISGQAHIVKILDSKEKNGFFVDSVNGVKSLVTYASSGDPTIDWKYISVIPYKNVTKNIDDMREKTVFYVVSFLLLGLILSYIASKRLYIPIDKMSQKLNKMVSLGGLSTLKQDYLRSIIKADPQYSLRMLMNRFNDLNISLDPAGYFLMAVLKIDCFADFCSRYSFNDRRLYKFAMMNIAGEIASKHFKSECIDMGNDDQIVMLMNVYENQMPEIKNKLDYILKTVQSLVKEHLDTSLSAFACDVPDNIENIKNMYQLLLDATSTRMFLGHGCLVYVSGNQEHKPRDYNYPVQKEKAVINALLLRKTDEAKKIYHEMIKTVKGHSYAALNMLILRLTGAINSMAEYIEKNLRVSIDYNFDEFIFVLNKLETLDEIHAHFYEVFEHITSILGEQKSPSYKETVDMAVSIIKEEYADENICVDSIASRLNISSAYLGRIFKAVMSRSVADYLTDERIKKAKILLASSKKPANEIAEEVGFPNTNYFYTIFRKLNGITPIEYRKKSICNGSDRNLNGSSPQG